MQGPFALADGDAATFSLTGDEIGIRIIIPSGTTVTVSKVDDPNASAHDTDTETDLTDADSPYSEDLGWRHYHVSAAGGPARLLLV